MAGFLQVEGLRELVKAMKAAEADVTELKALNGKAAAIVQDAAAPRTPRRSGKLAASVRTGASNRSGRVMAGKSSVPYAGPIHWGWTRRHIKAQPWLADTASATEDRWTDIYTAGMEELLEKIVKAT